MKKITVGCLLALSVAACGSDSSILTYEEFRNQAHHEEDTGAYIVNGDELVENEDEMRAMYARYLATAQAAETGLPSIEQGLIVKRVSGRDDKWAAATASMVTTSPQLASTTSGSPSWSVLAQSQVPYPRVQCSRAARMSRYWSWGCLSITIRFT